MVSRQDDHGNRAIEGERLIEQRAAEQREAAKILARARHEDTYVVDLEAERIIEVGRQQCRDEQAEEWGDRARRLAVLVCIAAVFGYMIYGLLSVYVFK